MSDSRKTGRPAGSLLAVPLAAAAYRFGIGAADEFLISL